MTSYAAPEPANPRAALEQTGQDPVCEYLLSHEDDFWSCRNSSARQKVHGFFQYPAMMVPEMMAPLLDDLANSDPSIERIYDPFMGSGTVMTETMLLGLDFSGRDINPLAVLLAKAKSGRFRTAIEAKCLRQVVGRVEDDEETLVESNFTGIDKWFRRDVQVALSQLVRSIRKVEDQYSRRLLWVALAETVRLSSNSRTSTFKLHIRPEQERHRPLDILGKFRRIARANLSRLKEMQDALQVSELLNEDGFYTRDVDVKWGDSKDLDTPPDCDALITSPPYGDNQTTVPYGQHSYLPLQWIDWSDIADGLAERRSEILASTHSIDSMSLGGRLKNALADAGPAMEASPVLASHLKKLEGKKRDRRLRVAAFFKDLHVAFNANIQCVKPNGLLVWVVGNRSVGGLPVPLDDILGDFAAAKSTQLVCSLERTIHSKRMASRNATAPTMKTERILVFRRGRITDPTQPRTEP